MPEEEKKTITVHLVEECNYVRPVFIYCALEFCKVIPEILLRETTPETLYRSSDSYLQCLIHTHLIRALNEIIRNGLNNVDIKFMKSELTNTLKTKKWNS